MHDTHILLNTILSLQPKIVVEGGKSREELVLELIFQLLEQIPPEFDLKSIARSHENDKTPMTIVLLQEIDRYNKLLSLVNKSLRDLQKRCERSRCYLPSIRKYDGIVISFCCSIKMALTVSLTKGTGTMDT